LQQIYNLPMKLIIHKIKAHVENYVDCIFEFW